MTAPEREAPPGRSESVIAVAAFVLCLLFNLWGGRVGWTSRNLPGVEFRQAQTAISAYAIQQDHDFSLAYPTPVLGKPWSIPMEFPLYQWTAVGVSDLTGLGLVKSGRLVSLGCFYLCLPAVFLLLGRLGVAPGRRWLVLAVVVTCPLYIFYARAFLMETMALMFGLWFWVGFERAVETRQRGWLLVAMLAGSGAGLVKVTTFILYLLPAGWWALQRLWAGRRSGRARADFIWMALAVALPFALTLWWLHFADETKALNPSAQFLREANLRDFTFGTWAMRFSPEFWRMKWNIITEQLTWWPVLAVGLGLVVLAARQRAGDILRLLLWFGAVLAIFPVLYAQHEYYFIANAMLLLMALGLGLVGLAESGRARWLLVPALLAVAGGQAWHYLGGYYQAQRGISYGGDGLSQSLRGLTRPEEVLVITGQDWNAMTPYYARRRALMIRSDVEQNRPQLDAAFAALAGEKIGALVLGPGSSLSRGDLIRRAEQAGLDRHPAYRWRDFTVYLRADRREEMVREFQKTGYDETVLIPLEQGTVERLADGWFQIAQLTPAQREFFSGMKPKPVRFFSTFGPAVERSNGREDFGAHPVTRLVFALPAGDHRLRSAVSMAPETYDPAQPPDRLTDGVEVTLRALTPGGAGRVLFTRLVNPRDNPGDRGLCPLDVPFALEQAGEVELFFGPGPAGRDTHDSILLGRLEIQ